MKQTSIFLPMKCITNENIYVVMYWLNTIRGHSIYQLHASQNFIFLKLELTRAANQFKYILGIVFSINWCLFKTGTPWNFLDFHMNTKITINPLHYLMGSKICSKLTIEND